MKLERVAGTGKRAWTTVINERRREDGNKGKQVTRENCHKGKQLIREQI